MGNFTCVRGGGDFLYSLVPNFIHDVSYRVFKFSIYLIICFFTLIVHSLLCTKKGYQRLMINVIIPVPVPIFMVGVDYVISSLAPRAISRFNIRLIYAIQSIDSYEG